jgi:hypothetical protein
MVKMRSSYKTLASTKFGEGTDSDWSTSHCSAVPGPRGHRNDIEDLDMVVDNGARSFLHVAFLNDNRRMQQRHEHTCEGCCAHGAYRDPWWFLVAEDRDRL